MWNALPPGLRIAALLISVALGLWGGYHAAPRLNGAQIKPRIGAFELAGTPECSRAILEKWGPDGTEAARKSLYWDFVFILGYAVLLNLLCGAVAAAVPGWLGRAAGILAPLQFLAGLLDVCENLALLAILRSRPTALLTALAALCAGVKFLLTGLGVLVILAGGVAWLWSRPKVP